MILDFLVSHRVFNFWLILLCGMDQGGKLLLWQHVPSLAARSALTLCIRSASLLSWFNRVSLYTYGFLSHAAST